MKAIILAAGEGKRLRPFTMSRPKGMILVGNIPILEHIVKALVDNGVNDIIMVVGYRKNTIMLHFQDGRKFGASIEYVFQEKPLGTAHALAMAEPRLDGEDFLIVAGDSVIDAKLISDLLDQKDGPTMVVAESEIPSKYGVVNTDGDRIVELVEKPEIQMGNIINTGIYYFPNRFANLFKSQIFSKELGITQLLSDQISDSLIDLKAVKSVGRWNDAVYPWDLLNVNAQALDLTSQIVKGTVESNSVLKGAVNIGAGTRIRSGCYIEGPVIIGEGCDIGPNVVILSSTSIGNGVQIGPFSYISHCLVMSNALIGSHSHVSRSVIGDGVRARAGLFAPSDDCTVRLDHEIFNLHDVGVHIGQDTTIGSRVVISPGAVVGADCRIRDGVRVSGSLENKSVVV